MLLANASWIVLPIALLALTVSGIIVVAGWNRRRELLLRSSNVRAPDRFALGQTPFASGPIEVASEASAVLAQFAGLAASRFVALELAVQPGLTIRADPRAFREILFDLISSAVDHTPCGRVLLGARRNGPRVLITVSDDSVSGHRQQRISELRPAERLAALHGAVLNVETSTGGGTTIALSVLAGNQTGGAQAINEPIAAASVWGEVSPATH